jgi:hypothetical protein
MFLEISRWVSLEVSGDTGYFTISHLMIHGISCWQSCILSFDGLYIRFGIVFIIINP